MKRRGRGGRYSHHVYIHTTEGRVLPAFQWTIDRAETLLDGCPDALRLAVIRALDEGTTLLEAAAAMAAEQSR